jgi:hypothetical protein
MKNASPQQPSAQSPGLSSEITADASASRIHRLMTIGQMTAGLMHDSSGIHLGERCSNVDDARAYLQVALDGVARANEFTSSVLAFAAHNSEDVCFAT